MLDNRGMTLIEKHKKVGQLGYTTNKDIKG